MNEMVFLNFIEECQKHYGEAPVSITLPEKAYNRVQMELIWKCRYADTIFNGNKDIVFQHGQGTTTILKTPAEEEVSSSDLRTHLTIEEFNFYTTAVSLISQGSPVSLETFRYLQSLYARVLKGKK